MEAINDMLIQALALVLSAVVLFLTKKVTYWLEVKATKEERENVLFWTEIMVKVTEDIYREKGQGLLKKEDVVKFLQDNGFNISESQMSVLVDAVVSEFNKNGWNKNVIQ